MGRIVGTGQNRVDLTISHLSVGSPADLLTTVEFDDTGDYLATGDRGGRIVIFQRGDDIKQVRGQGRDGERLGDRLGRRGGTGPSMRSRAMSDLKGGQRL